MGKPTAIDLFAGAGGLSTGFQRAGFDIVWANDIDTNCKKTFEKNHEHAYFELGDISKIHAEDISTSSGIKKIDLIVGGPPCQGFSLANMQDRVLDNPKNALVLEFLRIVRELKPEYFVMENVEGLVMMNNGQVRQEIEGYLKNEKYAVRSEVLCAADYGVPQKRRRIVFVGNRCGAEIFFPSITHADTAEFGLRKFVDNKAKIKDYVTVGDAISDLPKINDDYGFEVADYASAPKNPYQSERRSKSNKVYNHVITKNAALVKERYKHIPEGGNWANLPEHLKSASVKRMGGHSYLYRRLDSKQPAATIANFRKAMLIHPWENRGLSVREAARLQSFDDDFLFLGGISSQQQQIANAVPPLLAEAVAKEILKTMNSD